MDPGTKVIACVLVCGVSLLDAPSHEGLQTKAPTSQVAGVSAESAATQPTGASTRPRWFPKHTGPWNASLHFARSKDGKVFEPSGKPIIQSAVSPTLVRLKDGRLLAVFEHYASTDKRRFGSLALVVSRDDGQSWTEPKPLDVRGLSHRMGRPQGPALAVEPGDRLQLVFTCKDRRGRRTLFEAESGENLAFRLKGRLDLQRDRVEIEDPAVVYLDNKCHLFGSLVGVAGQRCHAVATSGRRFKRLDDIREADVGIQGCVLAVEGGYRFYATSPAGVLSATSTDAKTWTRDEGLRIKGGEDPAVGRLADGSFVMLYVKWPPGVRTRRRDAGPDEDRFADSGEKEAAQAARAAGDDAEQPTEDAWGWEAEDAVTVDDRKDDSDPSAEDAETAGDETTLTDAGPAAESPEDAFSNGEPPDDYEIQYTDNGVPVPDFQHLFDYRRWFEDRHDPDSVADNAYDYYAALLFDADGRPIESDDLPSFQCMFNDFKFVGPPAPWNPVDHPEWEASYQATADLVALYAEAAAHRDHVRPIMLGSFDDDDSLTIDGSSDEGDEQLNDLMLTLLLPDLSMHRRMVKQTLSRAWRAEDGAPDPTALFDAFDTSLGSAQHVMQGDTLIEMLLGMTERNVVEENARWALQHEVFTADEMEATLDLLVERDERMPPASQWMTGELAMCLDTTQYLFGPIEEGREPSLNPQRVERFNKLFGGPGVFMTVPTPEEIAATPADRVADNFIEYNDRFSAMVERGYPEFRAKDIDEMTGPYVKDNPVSRVLLPSLSRVHQLATRHEASRRATQLTYAIHLHKQRTGDWPATLDDLPARYTQDVRVDPFSGGDFVYCPTEDGFTLYSSSENGVNDGGAHNPRWGDETQDDPAAPDDYVFWPPKERR